jgi:hypothetical protein
VVDPLVFEFVVDVGEPDPVPHAIAARASTAAMDFDFSDANGIAADSGCGFVVPANQTAGGGEVLVGPGAALLAEVRRPPPDQPAPLRRARSCQSPHGTTTVSRDDGPFISSAEAHHRSLVLIETIFAGDDMRRFVTVGLLFTAGCLSDPAAPSDVVGLQVSSNASANGVFVGDQVQLTATALDATGAPVLVPITYSSSNTAVATVNANGLIVAVGPGTTSIGVSTGSRSGSLTLVVDGNITSKVQVTPASPTVPVGTTLQLTGTVFTTIGNPARSKGLTWSTPDATKATVDTTGNVSGIAPTPGISICATASDAPSVKGCATVIVK